MGEESFAYQGNFWEEDFCESEGRGGVHRGRVVGSFRVDVIDVWNGMGCEIRCDVCMYVCINENQYLGGKLLKR